MRLRRVLRLAPALLALLAAAAACRSVPPPAPVSGPAAEAEREQAAGEAAAREGSYEKALGHFAAAWAAAPESAETGAGFAAALEGLKRSGDEAFRQGRLGEAGRRYAAALAHAGHPAARAKPPSFTKADLKAASDRAAAALMEKGLVEYRKGDLEAAVEQWRAILSFDPGHAEAVKSIQTATTQIENLKKLPPASAPPAPPASAPAPAPPPAPPAAPPPK